MFNSKLLVISNNQLDNRDYAIINTRKWLYNVRIVKNINKSYKPMSFLALKRLLYTCIWILVAVHTNVFLVVDSSYSKFVWLIKKIKNNIEIILLYKDFIRNNDLLRLCK